MHGMECSGCADGWMMMMTMHQQTKGAKREWPQKEPNIHMGMVHMGAYAKEGDGVLGVGGGRGCCTRTPESSVAVLPLLLAQWLKMDR